MQLRVPVLLRLGMNLVLLACSTRGTSPVTPLVGDHQLCNYPSIFLLWHTPALNAQNMAWDAPIELMPGVPCYCTVHLLAERGLH